MSSNSPRNLRHADRHEALGAVFSVEAGWLVPEHYGDPEAELAAARGEGGSGAVSDTSNAGVLEFRGPEAGSFLHRVLTQSIEDLPSVSWRLTAATDHKGRLIAAGPLLCLQPGRYFWLLQPGAVVPTLEIMGRYAVLDDVVVGDSTVDWFTVDVYCGVEPAGHGDAWFARMGKQEYRGISGEDRVPSLWEQFSADYTPIGRWVREIRRIETGRPAWGHEITSEHTPWDLGMTEYVSLDKGCYTGQETLNRLRTYDGVKKELVRLVLDGDGRSAKGERLERDGGEAVGTITSAEPLPSGGGVALAVVSKGCLGPGDVVSWSGGTGRIREDGSA